jgi:acetyl-CoA carboxylase carboxyltransferase component
MTDESMADLIEEVRQAKRAVEDAGRPEAVEKQHAEDKLTARERVDYLCEEFDEVGQLAAPAPTTPETADWEREDAPADGVVAGVGDVDGRPVAVAATDFTVKGGSIGHTGGAKMRRVMELALERGFPLVLLHDGGGHRIQEGLDARPTAQGDGGIFRTQTKLSGWVPIVSAMMGPGFAAPTNFSAMADFVPMVEGSTMGVAGPSLVKAALGVDLSKEELGGVDVQTAKTGMADRAFPDDEACLDGIREFLSYLPRNARREPPAVDAAPPSEATRTDLEDVMPADPKKGYDIEAIIEGVTDTDSFFELKPDFARNIVTGFARVDGTPVGVIANNPRAMAGTIDADASIASARFASLCDAFDLPILTLEDVPGILPGPDSEEDGVARAAGKLPYELNRATVPILNIVLRRGYGFGHVAMGGGESVQNVLTAVWPTAEVAAMGIEGAVDVVHGREIEAADDPGEKREELVEFYKDRTDAIRAVEGVGMDAVIEPADTYGWIRRALDRYDEPREEDWPPKKHSINPW